MGTVELLVGVVLGIDALIVLGVVASRINGRRTRRSEVATVGPDRLAAIATPIPFSGEISTMPSETSPNDLASADDAAVDLSSPATADPFGHETAETLDGTSLEAEPSATAGSRVEPELQTTAAPVPPAAGPLGLDYAPTWVDPVTMAAAAASEWRRCLRRDLARAARKGRPSLVMHLKLDVEGRGDLSIQELARFEGILQETIATRVRDGDYLDRTGPGRFHMIMSEMPESGAVAVADRIIHAYREDAPDSPRLLVGWAAMETEGDVALALQRAAERVRDGSLPLEGDLPSG